MIAAKKFLQQLMDAPVRNKTKLGTLTTLIAGGVAVLAYLLRAVARLPVFGGNWGLDDWVMTLAVVWLPIFSHFMYQNLQFSDVHYTAHDLRVCL